MGVPRVEEGSRRERGVGVIEYVILLIAIGAAVLVTVRFLGIGVRQKYDCVALRVANPTGRLPRECRPAPRPPAPPSPTEGGPAAGSAAPPSPPPPTSAPPTAPPTPTRTPPPPPPTPRPSPTPSCFDLLLFPRLSCPDPGSEALGDACEPFCIPNAFLTCEVRNVRRLSPPCPSPLPPDFPELFLLFEVTCRRCFFPTGTQSSPGTN